MNKNLLSLLAGIILILFCTPLFANSLPRQQVVLITGSFRGLGAQLAKSLLARGHKVILTGRDLSTAPEWINDEPNARAVVMDMNHLPSVEIAYAQAVGLFGRIDTIVHNAGQVLMAETYTLDAEAVEATLRVSVTAPLKLTNLALSEMKKTGFGRIIYLSSAASILPEQRMGAYSAAKAAAERIFLTLDDDICGDKEFAGCDIDTTVMRIAFVNEGYEPKIITSANTTDEERKFIDLMGFMRRHSPTNSSTIADVIERAMLKTDAPELVNVGWDGQFVRLFSAFPKNVRNLCTVLFSNMIPRPVK